jgi:hypothetical protein
VAIPWVEGSDTLADHALHLPAADLSPEYSYSPEMAPLDKVAGELRFAVATESGAEYLARDFAALLSLQGGTDSSVAEHVATLSAQSASSCPTSLALQSTGASLARTVRNRLIAGEAVPASLSRLLCQTADPGAVQAAAALVNTAGVDPLIRQCAVTALRNVHCSTALPALVSALESSDEEIAYTALMGLSAYATGMLPGASERRIPAAVPNPIVLQYSPSRDAFAQNPAPYRDYWRRWWKCEACSLGQPGCDEDVCRGYAASYTAQYDANWTCTSSGTTGCRKNLVTYEPATFKPEPPDADAPAAVLYTPGYIAYSSSYDASWTCTASGANGCRKNRLSYAPFYSPTGPDAAVPPPVIYTYGYVAAWSVGGWSGCDPSCGPGTQARSVTASSWKAIAPDASRPSDTQSCNYGPCHLTCEDYGLYSHWPECYAEWPYCDTRYRDDGAGGLLTCRHGYQ